ncbi:unnamed protein product [Notodromas monacha]|uniref:ACB domain-containing protein n=1 Tax=Notodromas monacha TaxID=399045 RepID=A0A7R9BT61_9CRUS|nr:unnamed protein product [Notodromas monacha]CAG0919835.1 unnamed protein product [Notodromas monacha]
MSGDSSELKASFDKAAEDVKNLDKRPSDDDLKTIYGLFKQATVGDCNTSKPGLLDFKGKAKWESWNALKGLSAEEAMTKYVEKVTQLVSSQKA